MYLRLQGSSSGDLRMCGSQTEISLKFDLALETGRAALARSKCTERALFCPSTSLVRSRYVNLSFNICDMFVAGGITTSIRYCPTVNFLPNIIFLMVFSMLINRLIFPLDPTHKICLIDRQFSEGSRRENKHDDT